MVCLRPSQSFNQAHLDWKREANQTYAHLKLFFEQRDLDRKEVSSEAGEFGFGGNAQEEDSPQWDEGWWDFADANRIHQETIYNISQSNQQMQGQVQATLP